MSTPRCGWWVGPVWKDGGETCTCILPPGHSMPHRCTCGTWFEGCGRPPENAHPTHLAKDGRSSLLLDALDAMCIQACAATRTTLASLARQPLHRRTDPACARHAPPRGRLARHIHELWRGCACPACTSGH